MYGVACRFRRISDTNESGAVGPRVLPGLRVSFRGFESTFARAMNKEFTVEFECPQCGAPASLLESSRVFACRYCNVRSYLVHRHGFQYVLPNLASENREVIYFPYWRFRGVLFVCAYSVSSYVIDETLQATPSYLFPSDLGSRIQLSTIRFTGPRTKGRIFTPTVPADEAVDHLRAQYPSGYHAEFKGSMDIIYTSFDILDHTLYEATYNQRVDKYWDKKRRSR